MSERFPIPIMAYGMLQDPTIQRLLLRREPRMKPATVEGWRVAPLRDVPYPGLVRDPDSEVSGHRLNVSVRELELVLAFKDPDFQFVQVSAAHDPDLLLFTWELPLANSFRAEPGIWTLDAFQASAAYAPYIAQVRRRHIASQNRAEPGI